MELHSGGAPALNHGAAGDARHAANDVRALLRGGFVATIVVTAGGAG